jgi:hypothetical protein
MTRATAFKNSTKHASGPRSHYPDINAAAPTRQHHVNPNGTMAVYAPGFKYVLNLPREAIVHLPPASLNVTRLVLCSNYDARDPHRSCTMGERCKFVHADTGRAREHNIHVNYAWRSLDEITYERFDAGTDLHVCPPNSKLPSDVMDSGLVLKTKALESTRRPLSHCAHYYFNRTCNLGSDCHFIHAVFIDPTAKQHQRAPVPSQLGEGRELQLSKRQKEAHDETIARLMAEHATTAPTAHSCEQPVRFDTLHLSDATLRLECSQTSAWHAAAAAPSESGSSQNSARGSRSPASGCSSGVVTARYRHNPYNMRSSRVLTVTCHCN